VLAAASDEVLFVGAIYDKDVVAARRFYAKLYIYGHQVGGTNPSLVEAMGAGCAVLAHDNQFNRCVAGFPGAMIDRLSSELLDRVLANHRYKSNFRGAA